MKNIGLAIGISRMRLKSSVENSRKSAGGTITSPYTGESRRGSISKWAAVK